MLESLCYSFQYLGGSQTFLGTLAAIIVMCMIAGEGNFIYKVLESIVLKLEEDSKGNPVASSVNFDKILKDDAYKIIKIGALGKCQIDDETRNEASDFVNKVSTWINKFQYSYVPPKLENNHKAQEHFLAPTYTFIFILAMFACDELLRSQYISYNDYIVSAMSFFAMFSFLYWIVVWFCYARRLYLSQNTVQLPRFVTVLGFFEPYTQNLGSIKACALRMIVFLLGGLFSFSIFTAFPSIKGSYKQFIFWSLFVLIPIALIALPRQSGYKEREDKGYIYTIGHAALFMLLACVFSPILMWAFANLSAFDGLTLYYNDCFWLKMFTMLFVAWNGLFMPMVFPFLCYKFLCWQAIKKPMYAQKKANREMDTLIKEAHKLSQKINVD